MRIVHDPEGTPRTLAHEVERAESLFAQARGLMFRRSIPDDYALVFPFDDAETRSIHMLFVPFPLDVLWLADDEVQAVKTVPPWYGVGWARADTLLELPAGAAAGVSEGDTVVVAD
ncbi:DUF192 domain-containing protein [Haloarcula pellucida]|uniref:DUF192 domain-containing protein n=1 Tax=Haloarcula pellucida TaxID=1427151 RepID=A0A830GTS6_9EURY|nr:DUF192 domain-containing protein [Halomicroarcula pellucida]MBX0350355.1 DUF192 domain-containing protein [Halomicroarcula pellucida]GGO01660.1 hypothetical protein GCM10009030_35580 [Halomicroarcula pellucida]